MGLNFSVCGTFAEEAFRYQILLDGFEEHLHDLTDLDWARLTFDDYDTSMEFKEVEPVGAELTPEAQAFIHKSGFVQCWLCYEDGSQRHYHFGNAQQAKSSDQHAAPHENRFG